MPEVKQGNDVESQNTPNRKTSPQVYGSDTEHQTRSTPVQCLNDSQENQPEVQEFIVDTKATHIGDDDNPPPKTTAPQIEFRLVRDETRNELYMPQS